MRKLVLAVLLAGACAPLAAQAPPTNTAAAAQRDLWLGTEGRYVRQWRVLGPMSAADADALAPLGQPNSVADSAAEPWRPAGSYGDVFDGFSGAGMKNGEAGFALATIERAADGDALVLLGGNVRGLWINGAWNGGAADSPAFVIDGTEVKARLKQGPNRILLRVARLDRPVLLSLRVVEPGFTAVRPTIAPYIVNDIPGTLHVMPGARPDASPEHIIYEVVAPGGRVQATQELMRSQEAKFLTGGFRAGPYEVRVRTRDVFGAAVIVHLPWYQGDASADVQRVLAAAAAPGADAHVRMLAEMLRDRADGDVLQWHSPLMEYAELMLERAGQTGGARGSGFVRLAWIDDIDGSTQFCRAYLPAVYPAKQPVPALIFLHGYNPPNPPYVRWWSIADRHNGVAERHDLIVLEPMGRGNVDYRWMGERDVLRCLSEAQAHFNIDADRVYLTGESMGGNGTWLIASRNPQLFAAAAPVFGGWDYRINFNGYAYTNPLATRPMEHYLQEAHASFAGAEGLLNVPLYVLHGDSDNAVPVDFSRHGVQRLQRWGYDVRYREIPGRGHEDLKARDEIADWLLEHTRPRAPREVRLRSYDLAGARAHWLQITGLENPFEMIEARASLVDEQTIRLDTKNVASVRLTPPEELLFGRVYTRNRGWQVIWNGSRLRAAYDPDGGMTLLAPGVENRDGDKSPDREGRLTYFFNTPFAVVIGTSAKDPALRAAIDAKARGFVDLWQRWQHVSPRVYRDTEVTREIEQRYSLLLVGGADANAVSARLAPKLPMAVTRDAVTLDGRRFPARDAVAQLLYPSPASKDRYVLLVAPTSAAGLRFWNPGAYWHALNGFPLMHWDWNIVDGRHVPIEPGLSPDRGWIAAGIFDRHWRRDDRFTVTGDAAARAQAPLRKVPVTPPTLSAATLAGLVGQYRIDPDQIGSGGIVTVAPEGQALTATQPESGFKLALEAESARDFAVVGTGAAVSFAVDGAGNAARLTFNHNGLDLVATKLDSTNR